ncbi:malate synthase [Allocatelliglobosispora scoriae]|uniref:Malate synthase n=1 Tax=Allocatelliglobosispora scoriae TaxID=643052 RepID=A0A841BIT8_9ACTN|nr:malate synthase A [Allocatelliglobosispora scoriae]MBB5866730.1 malate synthase [Allocatelliglobosispora scoriae]
MAVDSAVEQILTSGAIAFVTGLEREFRAQRRQLLRDRQDRADRLASGGALDFPTRTASLRADPDWRVRAPAHDLVDRRVEIAGPAENRKLAINALNSGAQVWVADLEDATSPTWANIINSQVNLRDAVSGTIEYTSPEGRLYRPDGSTAVIVVRPRGWHLPERHVRVDGVAASASLVDFGLYFFHCARALLERGSGPYFYLPKLEGQADARLWNDVFQYAQDTLGIPRGSVRAAGLIEDICAAFEMPEILYELRDHTAGLTAGRWDYLFSIARNFRNQPEFVLPDRAEITMDVPFLQAYTALLVQACHERGAHAIGGVAAQIPQRGDPAANARAMAAVRADKQREVGEGFDGTWVIHPDYVPVCAETFDLCLRGRPHQIERRGLRVEPRADALLGVDRLAMRVTERGLRSNVAVSLTYLECWLRGRGSVGVAGLMEGTATVEIARSQIWQWIRHGVTLADGRRVTEDLVRDILAEEVGGRRPYARAAALFEEITLGADFPAFLTIPGYERLLEVAGSDDTTISVPAHL